MEKGASDSTSTVKADELTTVRRLEQLPAKWKIVAAVAVVIVIVLSAGVYALSMQSWNGNDSWGMVPPIGTVQSSTATNWTWTIVSIGGGTPIQKSKVYVEVENQLGIFTVSSDLLSASGTYGFNYTSASPGNYSFLSVGDQFRLAKTTGTIDYGPGLTIFLLTPSGQGSFAVLTVPGGSPPLGLPEPIITSGMAQGVLLAWLLLIVAIIVMVLMAIFILEWKRDRKSLDKATSLILLDLLLYVIVIIGGILSRPLLPGSSAPSFLTIIGMIVWIIALAIDLVATGVALRTYERPSSKIMASGIGMAVGVALIIVAYYSLELIIGITAVS